MTRFGFCGQLAQDQHEDDQGERLDEELGEREVGGAVEREQHAAAVARDTDDQRRRESVTQQDRCERGRGHDPTDHHLDRRVETARRESIA